MIIIIMLNDATFRNYLELLETSFTNAIQVFRTV